MKTKERQAKRSELEYQKVARRMRAAIQIADAMNKRGVTKKQLAEMMGRRPSEITKWLSGDHNFTLDTLTELSYYLKEKITGEVFTTENPIISVLYTPQIEQFFPEYQSTAKLCTNKKWSSPKSLVAYER